MFTTEELCRWTGGASNAAATGKTFKRAVFDSRIVEPGDLYVALKGGNTDGHRFVQQAIEAGAAAAVVRLDWPPCGMSCAVNDLPLVRVPDPKAALADAARGYRNALSATVVGVTGSAGKTTTKELLARCLSAIGKTHATAGNFNNDLGLPVTILAAPRDARFLVLEMGTNHPGEIEHLVSVARPDAGVVTNIGNAHIEFFKTLDGTAREKGTLIASLPPDGFAVIDRNGAKFRELSRMASAQVIDVGVEDRECAALRKSLAETLPGEHNVLNARMAQAVAMRLGASEAETLAALRGFTPPGHRWRKVEWRGASVIDDTYNANPESMVAALSAFNASAPAGARRIAVLGRMGELGEQSDSAHDTVLKAALAANLDHLVLVDWPNGLIQQDLQNPDQNQNDASHSVNSFQDSVNLVKSPALARELLDNLVRPGDAILLKASRSLALETILE